MSAGPYSVDKTGTLVLAHPGMSGIVGQSEHAAFWTERLNSAHALGVSTERARVEGAGWLIWSNEHDAWWGPNRSGYYSYSDIKHAGRYTLAEAHAICVDAGTLNRLKQDPAIPAEVVVPSPEMIDAALRGGEGE